MTTTQQEFWQSTGPTSEDGETFVRFLPTPTISMLAGYSKKENCSSVKRGLNGSPLSAVGNSLLRIVRDEPNMTLTSSQPVGRARTSALPVAVMASTVNDPASFSRSFAWFDSYAQNTSCWKTWQRCLIGDWIEFSESWPRSGMMRSGIVYRLPPLVPRISGTGCSSLPTLRATDGDKGSRTTSGAIREANRGRNIDLGCYVKMLPTPNKWDGQRGAESRETKSKRGNGGVNLLQAVKMLPSPAARDWKSGTGRQENGHTPQLPEVIGGQLNPQFVSWLMGFPVDWCDMPDEQAEEPQTESPSSDA